MSYRINESKETVESGKQTLGLSLQYSDGIKCEPESIGKKI